MSGALSFTVITDTNGEFGISDPNGSWSGAVNGDSLTLADGEGATTLTRIRAGDADGDGVLNVMDNCRQTSNADQRDTNADFNGDGSVNAVDLGLIKSRFFAPPGPSTITLNCRAAP